MLYRTLGQTDVAVSAIGLGCWGMSGAYGSADEREAAATLHRALDEGVNLLDTADVYGDGHNESLIGRVLAERRSEFLLASKTGFTPEDGSGPLSVDLRPERIRKACEASLQRLETDTIDLYYLHRIDPVVPIEDSVGAVAELAAQGKVRFLGLCEAAAGTVRRAHAIHPVTAVQSEYSLWTRDIESAVLPLCKELSITVVPFSPLGRGFLTGQVVTSDQLAADDWRATNPRFAAENLQRNLALLGPLRKIAAAHACNEAQVALAWLLARGNQIVPIPGTKQRRHLDENLQAMELALSDAELETLSAAFPPGAAMGERYSADLARWLDRDRVDQEDRP